MTVIPNYETVNPTLTCASQSVMSRKTMWQRSHAKIEYVKTFVHYTKCQQQNNITIQANNNILKIWIEKHKQNKGIID